MRKPTIQFKKADFNTVDGFLKNNFSERKSTYKVYLERQIKPLSWSGNYIPGPVSDNPWIIIKREKHIKIGEIMYQPGPDKDSMIFETETEFNFLIHKLIDEIIKVLEFYGFAEVAKLTELDGSIISSQNKKYKVGHPGLHPEVWADRIEKVLEGEDLMEEDPTLLKKQIPEMVGWRWGEDAPNRYKSYMNAKKKLDELMQDDPNGILDIVRERRMNPNN